MAFILGLLLAAVPLTSAQGSWVMAHDASQGYLSCPHLVGTAYGLNINCPIYPSVEACQTDCIGKVTGCNGINYKFGGKCCFKQCANVYAPTFSSSTGYAVWMYHATCGLIESNTLYVGDDLRFVDDVLSAEACCQICSEDASCKSWVWKAKRGQADSDSCHLKNTVKPNRQASDCCISGLPSATTTTTTTTMGGWVMVHDASQGYLSCPHLVGTAYGLNINCPIYPSVEACQTDCIGMVTGCNGINYKSDGKCCFKQCANVYAPTFSSSTGYAVWMYHATCSLIESNTVYVGDDLRFVDDVLSAEACCQICSEDASCKSWVWKAKRGQADSESCHLKNTVKLNRQASDCCISGLPSATTTTTTTTMGGWVMVHDASQGYLSCPHLVGTAYGLNINCPIYPSVEACQTDCIGMVTGCNGINYKSDGKCCFKQCANVYAPTFSSSTGYAVWMYQAWAAVTEWESQACRGSTHTDNSPSYYTVAQASDITNCKALCVSMAGVCKGIEFSVSRCELWTRPEGIGATTGLVGSVCLRYTPAPVFVPVEGGKDRVCRGSTPLDNLASYFTVAEVSALRDCQNLCMKEQACHGIEYNGFKRCEIWTREQGIQAVVYNPGYTCMRYETSGSGQDISLVYP
ncbi:unnamed protein product [Polarella glacialis]|uniref:Apple domain-containing protein n=1 Tax=Polarella glacialis TaxID=89957 RepID=A0A813DB08_POLGL|nr:unnamed protein product [Polarella glacialis]